MNRFAEWDRWLAEEDSVHALAPEGYDDAAALTRVMGLRQVLREGLPVYKVRTASPELYQDGTGLVEYRITASNDSRPMGGTLAWVLLSHFGNLATVADCHDARLLADIVRLLEGFGLRYVDYDYLARTIYNGKCERLRGLSWANRYFSLAVEYNSEPRTDSA